MYIIVEVDNYIFEITTRVLSKVDRSDNTIMCAKMGVNARPVLVIKVLLFLKSILCI